MKINTWTYGVSWWIQPLILRQNWLNEVKRAINPDNFESIFIALKFKLLESNEYPFDWGLTFKTLY